MRFIEGFFNRLKDYSFRCSWFQRSFIGKWLIFKQKPERLSLHITQKCNLRCTYCLYLLQENKHFVRKEMDNLDFLEELLEKTGIRKCTISAEGEPLLHSGYPEIVKILRKKGIKATGITNGILLDKYCDLMLKNLERINVSLSGYDAESFRRTRNGDAQVFEKILSNIQLAVQRKRELGSNAVIAVKFDLDKGLLPNMEAMIQKARGLNVDEIIFGNINDEGTGNFSTLFVNDTDVVTYIEEMRKKYRELKIKWPSLVDIDNKGYCRMLFKGLVVNSDYALSPCCYIPGNRDIFGTVFEPKTGLREFQENFLKAKTVDQLDVHCRHCQRRMNF